MQTRRLGNTDLEFTTIGLGTWAIGGGDWKFGWGDQDDQEAIEGILKSCELGVNWIDTAAVYGAGNSEVLVGKALKQMGAGDRPYVATKCGRINQPDGTVTACITPESIFAECDASLKRLDLDVIDLYQVHWPDPDAEIETAWQAMSDLKKAGKVREIGVSNHNVSQMKRLQPIADIASLQPPYNMLNRNIEQEIAPFCETEKIGIICYSPMGKGILTGKFDVERAKNLSDKDHRSRDPKFASPQLEINLKLVERIRPIADDNNRPMAQLSLAWTLRRPEVTSAIVGIRRPDQIQDTIAASGWQLTPDEINLIDSALNDHQKELAEINADPGRV